jgi:hypothetical protein
MLEHTRQHLRAMVLDQEANPVAKLNTYIVSFSPAERTEWGGYTVKISLLIQGEKHEIEASSFADLEREVRKLAQAFGQTCSPYIRLKDGQARKPAGFDGWKRGLNIIDYVPPPTDAQIAAHIAKLTAQDAAEGVI